MGRPRPVLQDRLYLMTRRCTQRMLLLSPGNETQAKKVNQIVSYCLAEAAQHCKMDVLWFMAAGNHLHYGLHDTHGAYPDFLRRFHGHLAKLMNAHRGRWESFFDNRQTSVVHLADPAAVFEKMIYSLVNPVKDNIVTRATEWTGFTSLAKQLSDGEVVVKRPEGVFAKDGVMPAEVSLRFKRPKPFRHLSHDEWATKIRTAIAEQEQQAADAHEENGTRVLGLRRLREQSPFDCPQSHEPRHEMSPQVACKDKALRIATIQARVAFRKAYADALQAYREGDAEAVFPSGTWQLFEDNHVFREAA